jgi:hypothetical protein
MLSDATNFMLDNNRIKLKISDSSKHTGFIIESNDSAAVGYIGWAIEKHLDDIPSELKPTTRESAISVGMESAITEEIVGAKYYA